MVQLQQADQIWLYFIGRCFEMDLESRLSYCYFCGKLLKMNSYLMLSNLATREILNFV